ncbi:MAG: flavodoxin domain-containing protein [Candidatus Nezhaarchaeota archaeon]|nr:flavodoxin domain-containing protein [Candidatus Nezhaarchaeota archaeon]
MVYDSLTGNTARAAELITEGARAAGAEASARRVGVVTLDELRAADAVVAGCPTHAFSASKAMKAFLGRLEVREALKGKCGAAFTSCRLAPSALRWLEKALKEAGINLVGKVGVHSEPRGREEEACRELGRRVAQELQANPHRPQSKDS